MERFAELLVSKGLITAGDHARVSEMRGRTSGRSAAILVRLGLVSEADLLDTMAELHDLPLARQAGAGARRLEIEGLNRRFMAQRAVVPLALEGGRLVLAMADPEDSEAIDAMAFAVSAEEVAPVLATFSEIEEMIGLSDDHAEIEPGDPLSGTGAAEDLERLAEGESDAPVIRLVQRILAAAVNRRASDVHIEPMARHLSIRYRIDGRLVEIERHPDGLAGPIASRIKVMAGLDIAESRLPQDGRLRVTVRGRDVDVRVATSPIAYGESIVLRLLGRSEVPLDLERLGLPDAALEKLKRALDRPHGIILLTGPTGSGKTTTLYAAINRLRKPEVKILTVEDPVEVLLEGINQVQVRPEIGLSYAATLRAFLRQDPDILMIGEIRDAETAEIAMRAALTGHLVLSTLHTNSAIGAFTRLSDIGIEPYLTASSVIAAIAQRLIRALCEDCKAGHRTTAEQAVSFEGAGMAAPDTLFAPRGCEQCSNTGFRGRLPLMEILEVDDVLRGHVRAGDVEDAADQRPMEETLLGHGLRLAASGRTTLGEVQRAVQLS